MKVFISVDMEGISGLVRWADVSSNGIDFAVNRVRMTEDANAAIAGAFDGGASEVVVEENHGVEDLCVLDMDRIDPRCEVVRGAGRPGATTMAGLDDSAGAIFLVGHHGSGGSFPGIMAHTISYGGFRRVLLGGEPIGEADFFAIRGGELGIPVALVTGDQVVAEQVARICPCVETVVVKQAYANQSARCIPPTRAREMIRIGARRAVERVARGEIAPAVDRRGPFEFEVELRAPVGDAMRANLEGMQAFDIVGDAVVRVQAPDIELGFRRVAYLGYADRAGVTRH